jgi:hypothetical protein
MKKTAVMLAAGALVFGGAATASAASTDFQAGTDAGVQVQARSQVPDALKVPDGNQRIATFRGDGVQIYGCTNGTWTFIQPAATLSRYGTPVAVHFAGPSFPRWESTKDGSLVGAKKIAAVDQPGAVPQLLLQATENTGGPGTQFGAVTFVQRLNTRGGLAPAGACAAGAQVGVHYTADYAFWTAK